MEWGDKVSHLSDLNVCNKSKIIILSRCIIKPLYKWISFELVYTVECRQCRRLFDRFELKINLERYIFISFYI